MTFTFENIRKYTDMWEAGHTISEIIAAAWNDELKTEIYEYLLNTLCSLEGTNSLDVNITITAYHEC